jgi:hypothetical protein
MQNQPIAIDEETNKRLLRKVDWRLMPVVSSLNLYGGKD